MKKLLLASIVVLAIACNDNGNGSSVEDTTITNKPGVENVNGNIPDTSNTISVEGSSQAGDDAVDTTQKK